jgi:uncharacterized protein DUF6328
MLVRALEYVRRLRAAHKERATTAHQRTMTENTSLNERITQMLTEARVVLPGVQALLGFQLISVISQSFEKLPASSKLGHAVSLGCVTLAVILLMAPAAYHRIVFSGLDTEEVHSVVSWFVTCATMPLACGLAGDVYVVLTRSPPRRGSAWLLPAGRSCYSLVSGTSFQSSPGCGVTNNITAFASRPDVQDIS